MDNGPHLRTARGCQRVWRAVTRARGPRETKQGRRKGGMRPREKEGNQHKHVVFRFPDYCGPEVVRM